MYFSIFLAVLRPQSTRKLKFYCDLGNWAYDCALPSQKDTHICSSFHSYSHTHTHAHRIYGLSCQVLCSLGMLFFCFFWTRVALEILCRHWLVKTHTQTPTHRHTHTYSLTHTIARSQLCVRMFVLLVGRFCFCLADSALAVWLMPNSFRAEDNWDALRHTPHTPHTHSHTHASFKQYLWQGQAESDSVCEQKKKRLQRFHAPLQTGSSSVQLAIQQAHTHTHTHIGTHT